MSEIFYSLQTYTWKKKSSPERFSVNRPWALGVLCTSTLCKRVSVNREGAAAYCFVVAFAAAKLKMLYKGEEEGRGGGGGWEMSNQREKRDFLYTTSDCFFLFENNANIPFLMTIIKYAARFLLLVRIVYQPASRQTSVALSPASPPPPPPPPPQKFR